MFVKLCAASVALALPAAGFETHSRPVVRKTRKVAFDTHSVNGLATELQALEKRVDTIEEVLQAPHLSLQQVSNVQ